MIGTAKTQTQSGKQRKQETKDLTFQLDKTRGKNVYVAEERGIYL